MAVSAKVAPYTISLFRDITPSRPLLLERTPLQRTATTLGTSSPTHLQLCVGSLTFHRDLSGIEEGKGPRNEIIASLRNRTAERLRTAE